MKKYSTFILLLLLLCAKSFAQGVAVNTDGSAADASAMLDVKSTTKGILIPRVNLTSDVTSPVTGLLVFQTTAPSGFYYYSGASWLLLQNSGNVIPAANGGAGTVNGILTANGAGTVSAAATTGSGSVVLTNSPTLVTPALGTPSALIGTNISGTAAALTAGKVTTNANLTGDVTSVGNGTTYNNVVPANKGGAGTVTGILQANGSGTVSSISTTGGGNVVLATSPTLVTPSLGTPSALVGTNISGTAANLTAGKVTTNANLTGDVTSVGNATTYNNIVPIAKGGTGTGTTPSLVAGSNVTISGTWPNQTINASVSGSGFTNTTVAAGSSITLTAVNTFVYVMGSGATINLPASPAAGQIVYIFTDNATGVINANTKSIRQNNNSFPGTSNFSDFPISPIHGLQLYFNGSLWFPMAQ